jgi:transcriptional regulator with XRE-family HTH domain
VNYATALTAARERAGLSKRRLAIMVGVEPSYITHIEAGRRLPSLPTLELLANACGVTLMALHIMAADDGDIARFPGLIRPPGLVL